MHERVITFGKGDHTPILWRVCFLRGMTLQSSSKVTKIKSSVPAVFRKSGHRAGVSIHLGKEVQGGLCRVFNEDFFLRNENLL